MTLRLQGFLQPSQRSLPDQVGSKIDFWRLTQGVLVEFRRSIPMGVCKLTRQEVRRLVVQMGKEYKGNAYHLLQKNCNHFANALCQRLVGRSAPTWVC